jgi:hypothetical protein
MQFSAYRVPRQQQLIGYHGSSKRQHIPSQQGRNMVHCVPRPLQVAKVFASSLCRKGNSFDMDIFTFTKVRRWFGPLRPCCKSRSDFLDNGKIELISVLTLKEATVIMVLTSMKVTIKYNHRPESTIIRSAHLHTDKPRRASEVYKRTPMTN